MDKAYTAKHKSEMNFSVQVQLNISKDMKSVGLDVAWPWTRLRFYRASLDP